MTNYLIKSTDVYRINTIGQVESFHAELKNDPHFTLDGFAYKQKNVKEKGEIVEEYFEVTVKKIFNDAKDPIGNTKIEYVRD